jgi:hypothetical protein
VQGLHVLTKPPLSVAHVHARPTIAGLLQGVVDLASVRIEQAVLPQAGIDALIQSLQKQEQTIEQTRGQSSHSSFKPQNSIEWHVQQVVLKDITWQGSPGQSLNLNAQAKLNADGLPDALTLDIVKAQFPGVRSLPGTQMKVTRDGAAWAIAATLGGGAIKNHGTVSGKLLQIKLATGQAWQGTLALQGVDVSKFGGSGANGPMGGQLEAQTTLSARAATAGGLLAALQTQSTFTVNKAVLRGIDLVKAVRTVGLNRGGETALDKLSGQVQTRGKAIDLTHLAASSGVLSATGNVGISPNRSLSGRINVALGEGAIGQAVAVPLVVGGSLDNPEVTLTRAAMIGAAIGTVVLPGAGTGAGASVGERVSEGLKKLFGK